MTRRSSSFLSAVHGAPAAIPALAAEKVDSLLLTATDYSPMK